MNAIEVIIIFSKILNSSTKFWCEKKNCSGFHSFSWSWYLCSNQCMNMESPWAIQHAYRRNFMSKYGQCDESRIKIEDTSSFDLKIQDRRFKLEDFWYMARDFFKYSGHRYRRSIQIAHDWFRLNRALWKARLNTNSNSDFSRKSLSECYRLVCITSRR